MDKKGLLVRSGFVAGLIVTVLFYLPFTDPDKETWYNVVASLSNLLIFIGIPLAISLGYLHWIQKKRTVNVQWKKTKLAGLSMIILFGTEVTNYLLPDLSLFFDGIVVASVACLLLASKWSDKAKKETIQKH